MPQVKWERTAAEAKLEQIFRERLSVTEPDLALLTKEYLGESWSSLRHVDLILTVQNTFGFRFAYKEIVEIRSYEALRAAVLKHVSEA